MTFPFMTRVRAIFPRFVGRNPEQQELLDAVAASVAEAVPPPPPPLQQFIRFGMDRCLQYQEKQGNTIFTIINRRPELVGDVSGLQVDWFSAGRKQEVLNSITQAADTVGSRPDGRLVIIAKLESGWQPIFSHGFDDEVPPTEEALPILRELRDVAFKKAFPDGQVSYRTPADVYCEVAHELDAAIKRLEPSVPTTQEREIPQVTGLPMHAGAIFEAIARGEHRLYVNAGVHIGPGSDPSPNKIFGKELLDALNKHFPEKEFRIRDHLASIGGTDPAHWGGTLDLVVWWRDRI